MIGAPYSRSYARADGDRVTSFTHVKAYVNARVDFSVVELPKKGDEEQVRLVYSIVDEGDKVFINKSSSTALPATLIRGARNAGDQEGQFRLPKATCSGPIVSPKQNANSISPTHTGR